jgi:8-oxo-dGTP diphosphatase
MAMIDVTCAIIRNEEEEILVVQRGKESDHPLKWEFPGGKLHEGESLEDCIIREILEELSIDIVIVSSLPSVEHDYGFRQIRLFPFICDTLDEIPLLSEHAAYRWVNAEDLKSVDFCEADVTVASLFLDTLPAPVHSPAEKTIEESVPLAVDIELRSAISRMMGMKEAEWFAGSAIDNPQVFSKLLEYSFSGDQKLAFRASWTLTKVCDKDPQLIYPYIDEIVLKLGNMESESAIRSFLRIISLADLSSINMKRHGILTDYCFGILKSGFSAVALKAYAMEILYKLALIYPELGSELEATISILQIDGSAGILSRGRQILRKLASR